MQLYFHSFFYGHFCRKFVHFSVKFPGLNMTNISEAYFSKKHVVNWKILLLHLISLKLKFALSKQLTECNYANTIQSWVANLASPTTPFYFKQSMKKYGYVWTCIMICSMIWWLFPICRWALSELEVVTLFFIQVITIIILFVY